MSAFNFRWLLVTMSRTNYRQSESRLHQLGVQAGLICIALFGLHASHLDAAAAPASTEVASSQKWKVEDGWSSIVPGSTTFESIVKRFGPIVDDTSKRKSKCDEKIVTEDLGNSTLYHFQNNWIRVWVPKGKAYISGIKIFKEARDPHIPRTLAKAEEIFGLLQNVEHDSQGRVIFQGRGVALQCYPPGSDNNGGQVLWLSLFVPK